MYQPAKAICLVATIVALFLVALTARDAKSQSSDEVDLIAAGAQAWCMPDTVHWKFADQQVRGRSPQFGAPTKAPESSAWLLTDRVFGGDNIEVHVDATFSHGRYLGLYIDYDRETQTGIWMATGHPVVESASEQHLNIEAAYIKTVENGDWVVRTEGELIIEKDVPVHLVFAKSGDDYSIYENDRLIITYRKPGYKASALQLRIVDADVSISRLEVKSDIVTVGTGECS